MDNFLEDLKKRAPEAQKKFTESQQKLIKAQGEFQKAQQELVTVQNEFQVAAQEHQAFQTLIASLTPKTGPPIPAPVVRHVIAAPQTNRVLVHQSSPAMQHSVAVANQAATSPHAAQPPSPPVIDENKSESNKTQAVRELLRQHPAGMTPGDMWGTLQSQFSNRAYLYSVLKRLRDRGEVRARRGKYYYNVAVAEPQNQSAVVQ